MCRSAHCFDLGGKSTKLQRQKIIDNAGEVISNSNSTSPMGKNALSYQKRVFRQA